MSAHKKSRGKQCPRCGRILLPDPATSGWPRHYGNPTDAAYRREWCALSDEAIT